MMGENGGEETIDKTEGREGSRERRRREGVNEKGKRWRVKRVLGMKERERKNKG